MWLARVKGTLPDTVQCNYSLIMQHSVPGHPWTTLLLTYVLVLVGIMALKLGILRGFTNKYSVYLPYTAKKTENCWSKAHYYSKSVLHTSWIVTMSGWLTHCHVLIMKACASRSCSTAVAPCLTGRHDGAIVIWHILYRSCGGDTRLLIAHTPSLFCLSPLLARREKGLQWWERLFTQ